MRTCPFDGCRAVLPDHLFACRQHWHTLTPKQQRRIYAIYHDYLEDRIGIETLVRFQNEVLDEVQGRSARA